MPEYEPLVLSAQCNTGPELYDRDLEALSGGTWLYPRDRRPPTGSQTFHGLHFQIGATDFDIQPSFIGLGEKDGLCHAPVTVPVGKSSSFVIFAHALLESELWRGGPLGVVAAHYRFRYADGEPIDVPIRERFEVGNLPLPWGQYPFLAVADQPSSLADRYAGPWEMTGFRQTEASQGTPRGYFLMGEVEARARSIFPIHTLRVIQEGTHRESSRSRGLFALSQWGLGRLQPVGRHL